MSNQSFAQVPLDIEEPDALRKFLQKLVEEIDFIEGNRAADPYVKESQLTATPTVNLTSVTAAATALSLTVDGVIDDVVANTSEIADIQVVINDVQYTVTHQALDPTYNDFDNAAWGNLKGKGQFSALGSAMTAPPFVVTGGTTYIVYIDSALTTGGGVTQRVMMEDTGVDLKVFYRTGDSFAVAVTNGWTQL